MNPGVPIPPAIQALTGITDAMVRDAPPFAAIADEVAARTADALFVAHNARFDYGFLKHAFARLDRRSPRACCARSSCRAGCFRKPSGTTSTA